MLWFKSVLRNTGKTAKFLSNKLEVTAIRNINQENNFKQCCVSDTFLKTKKMIYFKASKFTDCTVIENYFFLYFSKIAIYLFR